MRFVNQRVPFVIEQTGRGEREMDIFSRLLKDRVVFLTGGVDDEVANLIVAEMLFLSNEDPKADIHLYVNSPGGSVSAGLAIYDTMQYLRCDVATYNVGLAASMGAGSTGSPSRRSSTYNLGRPLSVPSSVLPEAPIRPMGSPALSHWPTSTTTRSRPARTV